MKSTKSEWQVVIGLEVHVQLATNSKIFSGASTQFGSEPNTQACNIDLGMPQLGGGQSQPNIQILLPRFSVILAKKLALKK